ncbi:MAG: glycosyltransferase family 2 protein [Sedimentisphaerales bacterium]|nr:glycosyltransferase family 2 protein [Sedimentisphaerales bacterium]
MKSLDVSIIIVSWNTRDILRNCMKSVYDKSGKVDFEVIVIDNASDDDSAEMVETNYPQAILIKNEENRGFAVANNQGMKIAKGRYVLLLNSDTVVLEDAIAETVSFSDAHPEAAAVGCKVLNPDRTLQPTCFMFPSAVNMVLSSTYLYKVFPQSRFFGRERMSWWDRSDTREVDVVTGCFMLVRREAIDQVGMMDERFFMYGEETDWCYRFKKSGCKVFFTPCAQIIHFGGQSTRQRATEMILRRMGSRLLFFEKHGGRLEYATACLLIALFFFLRVPFWLARTLVSKNNGRDCLRIAHTYVIGGFYALTGGSGLYRVR